MSFIPIKGEKMIAINKFFTGSVSDPRSMIDVEVGESLRITDVFLSKNSRRINSSLELFFNYTKFRNGFCSK